MIYVVVLIAIIIIGGILLRLYEALIRSQKSDLNRASAISVSLGIVSFGMIGLSVPLLMLLVVGTVFIALIMQIVATVMGIVGLIFGIIGIRPIYVKRGHAIIGIILCAVSVIIGIGTFIFYLYILARGS